MTPVFDPDAGHRIMPETDVERWAAHVITAANAYMRGHLNADEWEREVAALLGGKNA